MTRSDKCTHKHKFVVWQVEFDSCGCCRAYTRSKCDECGINKVRAINIRFGQGLNSESLSRNFGLLEKSEGVNKKKIYKSRQLVLELQN
ncbi:hypothetical protein [Zooshikella sp. RANM57]|uniref:hypothetical protein n=1 Tax=Zooshikella sp. RANM57 TaxID=3425863 RepID=UPI003D6EF6EA